MKRNCGNCDGDGDDDVRILVLVLVRVLVPCRTFVLSSFQSCAVVLSDARCLLLDYVIRCDARTCTPRARTVSSLCDGVCDALYYIYYCCDLMYCLFCDEFH